MFKHLIEVRQGVYLNAPIVESQNLTPIVFSHGMGQMSTFFSTIFKDLALQGFIIYSLEHKDFTALHFKNPAG